MATPPAEKRLSHKKLERNVSLLGLFALVAVAIGGIVEIAPLFWIDNTVEKVDGMRPYTPLELAGRNIYMREGCYTCHSQMIRPFRDEVERYGHYSLAAESMYDHPFQWGSKRTGPDLARVGGRYSDEWHRAHLIDPRSVVPESIMPPYAFLAERDDHVATHLLKRVGAQRVDQGRLDQRHQVLGRGERGSEGTGRSGGGHRSAETLSKGAGARF